MSGLFRWETHCHTAEGSACARTSAADMARACHAAGYDGLIVTDHFFHGNTAVDRSLPWAEWTRQFCMGYHNAKAVGDRIGLRVLFGWEYSWDGNDFLTYGLSPEWLAAHPETTTLPALEYLKLIWEAGGIIVHAHPFREAWYTPAIKLLPDRVDAVEVFNAGNHKEVFNERARWYAESYGLPVTAGSDAHCPEDITSGILTDYDMTCAEDYRSVLQGHVKGIICGGEDILF